MESYRFSDDEIKFIGHLEQERQDEQEKIPDKLRELDNLAQRFLSQDAINFQMETTIFSPWQYHGRQDSFITKRIFARGFGLDPTDEIILSQNPDRWFGSEDFVSLRFQQPLGEKNDYRIVDFHLPSEKDILVSHLNSYQEVSEWLEEMATDFKYLSEPIMKNLHMNLAGNVIDIIKHRDDLSDFQIRELLLENSLSPRGLKQINKLSENPSEFGVNKSRWSTREHIFGENREHRIIARYMFDNPYIPNECEIDDIQYSFLNTSIRYEKSDPFTGDVEKIIYFRRNQQQSDEEDFSDNGDPNSVFMAQEVNTAARIVYDPEHRITTDDTILDFYEGNDGIHIPLRTDYHKNGFYQVESWKLQELIEVLEQANGSKHVFQ